MLWQEWDAQGNPPNTKFMGIEPPHPPFQTLHRALEYTVVINDRVIVIAAHLVRPWRPFIPSLCLVDAGGTEQLHFCGCEVYRCQWI